MLIREAIADDAVAACLVMRRSIAELCAQDHHDDPGLLSGWLANKTPEHFRSWIRFGNSVLVAVEGDAILAVGSVTDAGHVTLNYVSPDARFRGVSRAMIAALEARAMERGALRCTLDSTMTALRFYRANGYVETGPRPGGPGLTGQPMAKSLTRGLFVTPGQG